MNENSSDEPGVASTELKASAANWWIEATSLTDVNLEDFDANQSLDDRLAWAQCRGLDVGTIYSRFSTKLQHSTDDQVRECIVWAARNGIYVPPELISVDEGVKGKRLQRVGLNRTKRILSDRLAGVLLVFKASRLFRQAGKGYQFINEEVVEEGLRAVSVSQGIDTNDKKTWKLQLQIHGLLDDLLLDAIADHVRSGLTGLHLNDWTTGAIGVGYRRKEIPNAPATNRGMTRTMPEVDPESAAMIREHAELLLNGMSIKEGVRRWNSTGGKVDPRSTSGKMTAPAYRRLFANRRLVGIWEFGRRRNQFSTKLDYVRQVEQPDSEVASVTCEELRILDDETFSALQAMFGKRKTGPRATRKGKKLRLWDLTTEHFFCSACSKAKNSVRFYQAGANGTGMRCKNGDSCKCGSTVRREDAVRAVCDKIQRLIAHDPDLNERIVAEAARLDSEVGPDVGNQIAAKQKQLTVLSNRIEDLFELSGEGSESDRRDTKLRLRKAQAQRSLVQKDIERLSAIVDGSTGTLSAKQIRGSLRLGSCLLSDAANGDFGDDCVYKSLAVFRAVTGGEVRVFVETRANRKRTNVRGEFAPKLLELNPSNAGEVISVWLRKPPRLDQVAQRVHELIDNNGLSHRDAAKQLQLEGYRVNSGNVWYSYRRWYEMQSLPVPDLPYNNGKRRQAR